MSTECRLSLHRYTIKLYIQSLPTRAGIFFFIAFLADMAFCIRPMPWNGLLPNKVASDSVPIAVYEFQGKPKRHPNGNECGVTIENEWGWGQHRRLICRSSQRNAVSNFDEDKLENNHGKYLEIDMQTHSRILTSNCVQQARATLDFLSIRAFFAN